MPNAALVDAASAREVTARRLRARLCVENAASARRQLDAVLPVGLQAPQAALADAASARQATVRQLSARRLVARQLVDEYGCRLGDMMDDIEEASRQLCWEHDDIVKFLAPQSALWTPMQSLRRMGKLLRAQQARLSGIQHILDRPLDRFHAIAMSSDGRQRCYRSNKICWDCLHGRDHDLKWAVEDDEESE